VTSVLFAPSILAADFAQLGNQVRLVAEAGADLIHVDVMDAHFVPGLTVGPPLVASLRRATPLPMDVHLMVENPELLIPSFAEAGATWVSVHVEACRHLDRTLGLLGAHHLKKGVVLNPATPLNSLEEVLGLVDYVLLMTVNPGAGGQKFIPYCLEKIRRLRQMIQERDLPVQIEVDGGVDLGNVQEVVLAGADILVTGSAVFRAPDPSEALRQLRELAVEASRGQ
jgi:ribulose-phosphate 3-epimerase